MRAGAAPGRSTTRRARAYALPAMEIDDGGSPMTLVARGGGARARNRIGVG